MAPAGDSRICATPTDAPYTGTRPTLLDIVSAIDMVEGFHCSPAAAASKDVDLDHHASEDAAFELHVPRRKRSSRGCSGGGCMPVNQEPVAEVSVQGSGLASDSQACGGRSEKRSRSLSGMPAGPLPQLPARQQGLAAVSAQEQQVASQRAAERWQQALVALRITESPQPSSTAPPRTAAWQSMGGLAPRPDTEDSITPQPPARPMSKSAPGRVAYTPAQLTAWHEGAVRMTLDEAKEMIQATQSLKVSLDQIQHDMRMQLTKLLTEANALKLGLSVPSVLKKLCELPASAAGLSLEKLRVSVGQAAAPAALDATAAVPAASLGNVVVGGDSTGRVATGSGSRQLAHQAHTQSGAGARPQVLVQRTKVPASRSPTPPVQDMTVTDPSATPVPASAEAALAPDTAALAKPAGDVEHAVVQCQRACSGVPGAEQTPPAEVRSPPHVVAAPVSALDQPVDWSEPSTTAPSAFERPNQQATDSAGRKSSPQIAELKPATCPSAAVAPGQHRLSQGGGLVREPAAVTEPAATGVPPRRNSKPTRTSQPGIPHLEEHSQPLVYQMQPQPQCWSAHQLMMPAMAPMAYGMAMPTYVPAAMPVQAKSAAQRRYSCPADTMPHYPPMQPAMPIGMGQPLPYGAMPTMAAMPCGTGLVLRPPPGVLVQQAQPQVPQLQPMSGHHMYMSGNSMGEGLCVVSLPGSGMMMHGHTKPVRLGCQAPHKSGHR